MCFGENGTVQFLETLADNILRHSYSMMQIKKKIYGRFLGLPRSTSLNTRKVWKYRIEFRKSDTSFPDKPVQS